MERNDAMRDDAPKSRRDEDRLGHARFAVKVARVIRNVDARSGYVIGIHGRWGSGKSTTLNFVAELIQEHNDLAEDGQIIHIDFRPWLITGRQDLIGAFLKVLEENLKDKRGLLRRMCRRVAEWGKKMDVADVVRNVAIASVDWGGIAAGNAARGIIGGIFSRWSSSTSLQAAVSDMQQRLRDFDKRILVTVDDIDRLETAEIRSVMRMVKTVGHLPNVVYLLCYDRDVVWPALDDDRCRGPWFAEKIVQQELELPQPKYAQLSRLLDEEVAFLLADTDVSERWMHVVRAGIERWMRSPRDVVRLGNAVKFSWSAIEGEIDPQDLLAMEGLRLFDPMAFAWIRENRRLLVDQDYISLPGETSMDEAVAQLKAALPERHRAAVVELVGVLFPQHANHLIDGGGEVWIVEPTVEVVQRRGVGTAAGYDTYFHLHPSEDAVPLHVIAKVLSSTEADEVEALFRQYVAERDRSDTSMITSLLGELSARFHGSRGSVPSQTLLDALFAVGERIISTDLWTGSSGFFSVSPRGELQHLVRMMLGRLGKEEAGQLLVEAFERADSPAFLSDVFVSRGREFGLFDAPPDVGEPVVTREDFALLGQIVKTKIEDARDGGTLADAPFYFDIAESWRHVGGAEAPRQWLEWAIKSDASSLVKVCRGLVSRSLTGEVVYRVRHVPDEELFDLPLLREATASCDEPGLTQDERNLLRAVAIGVARILEVRSCPSGVEDGPES